MSTELSDNLFTTKQVAEKLGIKRVTVQKWCRKFGFKMQWGMMLLTRRQIQMIADRKDGRHERKKAGGLQDMQASSRSSR